MFQPFSSCSEDIYAKTEGKAEQDAARCRRPRFAVIVALTARWPMTSAQKSLNYSGPLDPVTSVMGFGCEWLASLALAAVLYD